MPDEPSKYVRQPIVSVLGHVDHGKTSLLDFIRGTAVVSREAGAITQHIGATEVPIDAIYDVCGDLLGGKKFTLPGLLFIDTPGHQAFTSLRARGGSLADLAVLIIDLNEGGRPQTYESINILKQYRTPFVIAANKIDKIQGWNEEITPVPMKRSISSQPPRTKKLFEEKLYDLIGMMYDKGFDADLYYNVDDFRKSIPIVPISSVTGEGIPDLLMILVGLAQRFLEDQLSIETGAGKGTVLEVKDDIGFGTTIDSIVYSGTIRKDDTLVIGTQDEPLVTKIKALLKPKPMDEIRDPREKFDRIHEVHAACGIKIAASDLDNVVPGAPIRVASNNLDELIEDIRSSSHVNVEVDGEGVTLKADTVGSLEAMAKECGEKGISIRKAEIGNISKRNIVELSAITDPLQRVLFAFNVKMLPEVEAEIANGDVKVFDYDVIYSIMEEYDEWLVKKKEELDRARRVEFTHPGMIRFIPEYVFRVNHPAIIGVRVLAGRIKVGLKLMRDDGKIVGEIKGIQADSKNVLEALQGEEVAVSIEGATVGRQIMKGDILYTVLPEGDARKIRDMNVLNTDEKEVFEKIIQIKRKQDKFWGM